MESALDAVLRVPELLESIVLNLPQKDILLSQRISTTFRDTIRSSPRCQKALFLAPEWTLSSKAFNAYAPMNRPSQKPLNNSLLLRAFPGCYPTVTLVIVNDGSSGGGNPSTEQDENGEFELALDHGRSSERWSWDVCISFPADKKPDCNPAVHYPEASWRRMFLSQPPCTDLHLVRRWQRSRNPAMAREVGITMGDFVGETTKPQADWHQSYISSDRDWHFEGNIRCSSIEAGSSLYDVDYAFSRAFRNGTVVALSDDWDPGRATVFRRAVS